MTEFYSTTHAAIALFSRYGVQSTRDKWRQSFLDVTARPPNSLLLKRQESGNEIHAVWMDTGDGTKIAVRLVYSPAHAKFVTALPPTDRRW